MRGDLVYEKLGEIDPALLEEAISAQAPSPNPRLTAPSSVKRSTGRLLLRMFAVAASILLGGILLVGGVVTLSRIPVNLWDTDPVETQPSPYTPPAYEGIVSIEGVGELAGLDSLTELGEEIKRAFNEAIPLEDVCECERDLPIRIGENNLTYCRSHGCFRDSDTGIVYLLSSEGKAFMGQALGEPEGWEPLPIFDYVYSKRRHGDDYMFGIELKDGGIFEIRDVYLRYMGDDVEYRTQAFHTILDRDSTYFITIPEDAPYGDYELVVKLYSPYTGRNIVLDIPSGTRAVTVIPAEREPAYEFDYACDRRVFAQGENMEVQVFMTNLGDDIYRWSKELSILPSVVLSTTRDGEILEFSMGTELELEWDGDVHCLDTYERSEARFWLTHPLSLPTGTYDLIISFEGREEVFPAAFEIVETTTETY